MHPDNKVMVRIVDNIEKVLVGKREAIEMVVAALMCSGHILVEDVPGVGKTSLVSALAKSINASFKRIQFTPDIMPSDITGFSMFNPKTNEFEYQRGSIFSNLILADEINRTPPKTQASLLEVMEERQVSIDGVTYPLPELFMVLATQNPIEYIGTYPLPEAQLDRFIMRITLGYPDNRSEFEMISRYEYKNPLESLSSVSDIEEILEAKEEIKKVFVADLIKKYVVDLADATRNHPGILLGASPRASLNLLSLSKSFAFYHGRDFVLPDDVQKLLGYAWSHRMLLTQDSRMKGNRPDRILETIIRNVRTPVIEK